VGRCETYRRGDPGVSNGEAKTQWTGVSPHFETVPVVTPSCALSDGPRTGNEDIDESPGALLPLRAGVSNKSGNLLFAQK